MCALVTGVQTCALPILAAGAADERPKLVDSLGMVRKPGFDGLFRRTRLPGDAAKPIEPELLEIAHQPRQQKPVPAVRRSEEHTSELQSLMRISYAVFCLNKKHK